MAEESTQRRDAQELLECLRTHLRLLRQYYWQAFKGGDPDFRGEVAAKLRLLACRDTKEGQPIGGFPLLFGVARDMGVEIKVTPGEEPPASDPGRGRDAAASAAMARERFPNPEDAWNKNQGNPPVTLQRYLDQAVATIDAAPRGRVQLTRKDVIAVWAQNHGARVEDWELGGGYTVIRDLGVTPEKHPEVERALQETAWTVLNAGEKFLATLSPEKIARKAAESALRARPQADGPSLARGIALAKMGNFEAALEEFKTVVAKDPWNAKAQNNRALVLHHLGRYLDAEAAYRECLRLDPGYMDPRYNLACLYALQGRFEDSLQELVKGLAQGGFSHRATPMSDPDFQKLREDPVFGPKLRALLGKPSGAESQG